MSNVLNLKGVKFFAIVMLAVAVLATFGAATVSAQQPVVSASDVQYAATVQSGSSGQAALIWQKFLNGYSSANLVADGKFGPLSVASAKVWQASRNLAADGVLGALSRASAVAQINSGVTVPSASLCPNGNTLASNCATAPGGVVETGPLCPNGNTLASNCATAPGGSTSAGPLNGTDGTIAAMTRLSQYNAEEVGAGQKNIKVLGFEIEASNDGDIQINSIKVRFDSTGNDSGDSDRLTDYVDSVSIWQGSTKIGSSDASDFTKVSTGIYTKVVTLSNAIVRADVKDKFYVSIDVVSNLDSGDIDSDSWTIALDNIRYTDGAGVVTTETSIIPAAIDWDNAGDGVAISFVSFSTAAETVLKINIDSSLQAGIQTVNTTSDTNDVLLLKGTFKVEGTSDVWLDEVPFLFTTNATNVDGVTATVYFTIDGTEFSESMTATAGTTEVITFNDLDKTLDAGATYTFTVTADVNDIQASEFDEGDYLSVALDATRRASIVAENEQGDQLTDSTEMTGVASGTIQYFYSIAPTVTVVSKSIDAVLVNNYPSSAIAKMKLAITAKGGTLYLNGAAETTQAKEFFTIAVDGGDASSTIADATGYSFSPSGTYTVTNSGADNEYYTLNDGDTMYVDIAATINQATGSSGVLVGMKGSAILFGTDSTSDTTRSANSLSFTALTDTLKTGKTTLSK